MSTNPAQVAPGADPAATAALPAASGPDLAPQQAAAVLADVAALEADLAAGTRGPTALAHLASFLVDVAALGGLVPTWLALPASVATPITVGAGIAAAAGHLLAWYLAAAKTRQNHATTTTRAVILGRHARH